MKFIMVYFRYLLSLLALSASLNLHAQKKIRLQLNRGATLNLVSANDGTLPGLLRKGAAGNKYYWVAHIKPNQASLDQFKKSEIGIVEKLAPFTYQVFTNSLPSAEMLQTWGIDAAGTADASVKMAPALREKNLPAHAFSQNNEVELLVLTMPGTEAAAAQRMLQQAGYHFTAITTLQAGVLRVVCPTDKITSLAELPVVRYLQPVNPPDQVLNQRSRNTSATQALQAPLASGGYNLRGNGITLGVGDDTDPSLHPDLSERIINHTPGIVRNHGAHVTGTVGGAGIILPQRTGYAPLAKIVSQWFSGIWQQAATYVQDYNMVVTNNSYGVITNDCSFNGIYDLSSNLLDQQAFAHPQLLHVFAAGNDGENTCAPYPPGYGTVLNAYQSAKNVITVGRTDVAGLASASSSKGPTTDGRLKPEILALGEAISSTSGQFSMGFAYYSDWGTSMAAPAVTGGLGLLYERYRQTHSNQNPNGALMKALLLNGARDLGTPGPDYRHGYGLMHLSNSLRMLEANHYNQDAIANGQTKEIVINVPTGVQQLKVMLYWHDQPANPLAAKTLVNDLDLSVVQPGGSVAAPLVLNHIPATAVLAEAIPGEDHTNNSEQVVINTPVAGNYTLRVRGYDVLVNAPQAYALVYDFVANEIKLNSPFAGDVWTPAAAPLTVSWDYTGTSTNSFTFAISYDDGANWTTAVENVASGQRYLEWSPPAVISTNVKMSVTKNGTGESFTSGRFALLPSPTMVSVPTSEQCPSYFKLKWRKIAGVDGYDVLLRRNGAMQVMATTASENDTTFNLSGLSTDSVYYASVRVVKNGIGGRTTLATERQPNSGNCSGDISNNDLALDAILSPVSGRQFSGTALGVAVNLSVRIRNLDDAVAGNFEVKYSINNSPIISQALATPIAALATYTHQFGPLDFSAPGDYQIVAIVKNTGATDASTANDTLRTTVRHLANPVINLSTPFTDGFESAANATIQKNNLGIAGTNAWDFQTTEAYGRLRTRLSAGVPRTGNRAITLDVSKAAPYVTNPINYLNGTFNLSTTALSSEVRFDFYYKHHGVTQTANPQNKVWARGSEADPWVEIYDLGANQLPVGGSFKHSGSIELSDKLAAAGQNFSTTTQVRFGQTALYGAADNENFGGYTFDDIRLSLASNDVQLISIDAPAIYNCGLTTGVPIKVKVRNSMNYAINNIPINYQINGGTAVNENVSIAANTTVDFTFATTANLSGLSSLELSAAVSLSGDNVPENNQQSVTISNQPVISSFPYLQDFESSAGSWFTSGIRSSWQWGTPNTKSIRTAASGTKIWKTNLNGFYNDKEKSYLYSPCFNISSLTTPTLSFSMAYDLEDCSAANVVCDAAWVEYSYDGINWTKLGAAGSGTNWYDYAAGQVWMAKNKTWWHVASIPLPKQAGNIALRFVMSSDDAVTRDGVAIDDIHIFDNTTPIFAGPANSNAQQQTVSGNGAFNFSEGGKILATLFPNGNNLGITEVRAWFHTGALRHNNEQYFANRNITVKPTNAITGSPAKLRFYFTDAEANELRMASGCAACVNPADYTLLNVTQYSDAVTLNEDGSLTNNTSGTYNSILNSAIRFVPYDAGYYADFEVYGFSEFWLTDGNADVALPAKWVIFEATKNDKDEVSLSWSVANEQQTLHYEPQVAAEGSANFVSLGTVAAKNSDRASYLYLDQRPDKKGVMLYRIKQMDADGSVSYSPTRAIRFGSGKTRITVFPNPVGNQLFVNTEATESGNLQWKITDMAGRTLLQGKWQKSQANEKWMINTQTLVPGVYQLVIDDGNERYQQKVVKYKE